ncbi:putative transcription factor GRAS family [Dioscorea sansibarensis]
MSKQNIEVQDSNVVNVDDYYHYYYYYYDEPTSVLDSNLSGSPATIPTDFTATLDFSTDDWSFLLPQKDHFTLPPPPPLSSNHDQLLDFLFRAASSIDSGDLTTAHLLLSRLTHLFPSISGPALHRSALYFGDSLLSLLSDPHIPTDLPADLLLRVTAYKTFSDLSPLPQFSSFTTNQILLESLSSNSNSLHLIDFDLGLGSQWSSFAEELAVRSRFSRTSPPSLRLTAVVPTDSRDSSLAADNLHDFARALGLHFSVDLVPVSSLGAFALSAVRFSPGESVAVVLTPAIFHLLGSTGEPEDTSASLLRFLRRASPRSVVFVDTEPCCCSNPEPLPQSFKRQFTSGIEFYSALLESLESAASATGLGDDSVRPIEQYLIRPRISSTVAACGALSTSWPAMFASAGFSPAPFSEFTESQAECLLRRAPVDGFHVERKNGAMVLSWRGREFAATSAWKC